ncbi:MAG: VWA domain-containing protein [Acidobacteriia bacterium]|nr:VWA domain-containing protein [Terriglobia bacterium]
MKKFCVFCMLLSLTLSAFPQTQSAPDAQPSTVIRANTRLVLVDVVATDHKGVPVTGLTAQDFTVLEDGKPQTVSSFSFQKPNAVTAGENPAPRKLPPNVFTNVPGYKSGGALNVILLDALNTTNLNQATVHDNLLKVMQKLPNDRPVAVYALGRRLTLLQDFTTDPALLQTALKGLKGKNSPVLASPTGGLQDQWVPPSVAQQMPPGMLLRIQEFMQANTAATTDLRVDYTLDALQALARSLAGYPGRKNLIWVSESFPLSITNASTLNLVHGSRGDRNYSLQLAHTADVLTSAQVAVYTVDARGISNATVFSASGLSSASDQMGRPMRPGTQQEQVERDNDETQANRSTENDVAQSTGGEAFYNTNDFGKVILKSMEDGSTYYSLAYAPGNKNWDGRFRKIQVKTSRSGVKLRYRTGYFASDPQAYEKEDQAQRNRDLAQALNFDFPASTALLFEARVLPPSESTGNKVAITFAIDPHPIVFEKQQDDLQHADLTCAVQVYSNKGQPLRTEAASLKAALPADIYDRVMKSHLPCQQTVDLPPGDYLLRLGIRDNNTGLMGTADARVSVTGGAGNKPAQ